MLNLTTLSLLLILATFAIALAPAVWIKNTVLTIIIVLSVIYILSISGFLKRFDGRWAC